MGATAQQAHDALTGPLQARPLPRHPDTAARKRAQRRGRERGCWVYIDAERLSRAGYPLEIAPPFYRCNGYRRSANGHTVIVSLYREA